MIIDAGPFVVDGERVNSRLWAIIKRASERDHEIHMTHPVLAQVWRDPARQANLARALRQVEVHALDESVAVGRRLAASGTSDVVDAHLAVVAERLGTFMLTSDPDDMTPSAPDSSATERLLGITSSWFARLGCRCGRPPVETHDSSPSTMRGWTRSQ